MQDTLTIRLDSELKQAAEKAAAERDETLSQVIRKALRDYIVGIAQSKRLPIHNTYTGRRRAR
jgi:predicted transcriptional regulator